MYRRTPGEIDDDSNELSIEGTSAEGGGSVSLVYQLAGQHPKL